MGRRIRVKTLLRRPSATLRPAYAASSRGVFTFARKHLFTFARKVFTFARNATGIPPKFNLFMVLSIGLHADPACRASPRKLATRADFGVDILD